MSRSASILVLLSALALSAQEKAPAPQAPPQDPKALALMDKADALVYSARRAGLKDVEYAFTMSNLPNIVVKIRWMAPELVKVQVAPAEGAPEQAVKIAEALAPGGIDVRARGTVDMVVGTETRQSYAGDEIALSAENQVKVTAKSPRSLRLFNENTITFDKSGLPVEMKSVTATGQIEMTALHEKRGEFWFLKNAKARTSAGDMNMGIETQEVSAFTFPSRIVTKLPDGSESVWTFGAYKVNQGLKEADFKD